LCLLAAEIMAKTGLNPGQYYDELVAQHGRPYYKRLDVAATLAQKQALSSMTADAVTATEFAGETILSKQTSASGNGASIGGLKVSTQNGWFAARPSGTENVYKIYAESFISESHLEALIEEAQALVTSVIA
jgi:phosphoglucomutase